MGGMFQREVAALQGNPMHQHASETEKMLLDSLKDLMLWASPGNSFTDFL